MKYFNMNIDSKSYASVDNFIYNFSKQTTNKCFEK